MPSLSHTEAVNRTALLRVTNYRVDVDLSAGGETFASRTTVTFTATRPGATTFLDVKPKALYTAILNGRQLDVDTLTDGRLPIPDLAADNELVVVADMRYSQQCEGLHRYLDPADGRTYLYAFAYLDNAPRIFACFDQPDLKAPFTFTVTAAPQALVFGNSPRIASGGDRCHGDGCQGKHCQGEHCQGGGCPGNRCQLAETAPLAPSLTTLAVGPFASFTAEHAGVRLALRCRASLAETLAGDLDELFEITGQCLDEFHRLFGVPYPFAAFDQIFVPELNALSLDHPGCVLLREQYLFGPTATDSERETRAVVIAHGMSLMWMAGLVTSAWWDDLWLGQAFADYMAHRVPSEVTRFAGPPTTFAVRRKAQALVADQRRSTHPVCLTGSDVQSVLMDLDRISYFKGHAVLRQLAARIGPDAMRTGLRTYLARHAYGNATFTDFLAALSEAAGADLTGWADAWLRTCNVNTLSAVVTVSEGLITSAVIEQTAPPSHPVLRQHTLKVGLYGPDGSGEVHSVEVTGDRTEAPQLVGRPAPALLLLNDGDLTYAKIRFDARSQAALPDLLAQLSPVNRAMVWCSLLMSVRDGCLRAESYLDLVVQMVAEEPELSILTEVLEHAKKDVLDRFLDPSQRPPAAEHLAQATRERLFGLPAGDERRTVLLRALIEVNTDLSQLRDWLDDTALPTGYVLDGDLRWRVRYRLAALGELSEQQIAAACAADATTRGEQYAARCSAARPDPAAKAAAWTAITTDMRLSNFRLLALADGFWQPEQAELTAPYVDRFFADMPAAARRRGDMVLDLLLRFLYPHHAASSETLRHAEKLLAREDISAPLRRNITDATDDLSQVVAARHALR